MKLKNIAYVTYKLPTYPSLEYYYKSVLNFQLEAVQLLSHGAATLTTDAAAQEIHQKTVAKYGVELRTELFGLGKHL